jgi:hypothetical protein
MTFGIPATTAHARRGGMDRTIITFGCWRFPSLHLRCVTRRPAETSNGKRASTLFPKQRWSECISARRSLGAARIKAYGR